MIRALIFDCFGVLYRDNLSMLYDAVPLESHPAMQDIIHATDHGFLSRDEYYEKIAELAGITTADVQKIEQRQHQRDESMIAYTQTFKPEYKIGLLSNIDSGSMEKLFPEPQRSELFDVFVISGDIGIAKPTLEIFEIAATRLGLRPEECVMIDDLPKNVDAAKQVGMHGILFTTQYNLEQELETLLGVQRA